MAAVRCPTCAKTVVWSAASPYRPFCSERCKNVDLGAWASERYAIPDEADQGIEGEGDEPRG
jgi:endogenous inhibitor of DNA gyrase (YacG/DUF329 family)